MSYESLNSRLSLIAAASVFSLLVMSVVALAQPSVDFTSPTPAPGETRGYDYAYLNASASDTGNVSVFFDIDRSLVLWMRMDDVNQSAPGALVYDNSSYGNNGTAGGDANQTPSGYFGKGYDFDGSGDYIDFGDVLDDEIGDQLTISAWVNPAEVKLGQVIIGKWSGGISYAISVDNAAANKFTFIVYTTDSGISDSATNYSANEWMHLVGTYNGTDTALYINGVPSYVQTDDPPDGDIADTAAPLRIGSDSDGSGPFNGTIDDVMFFNRSLSAAEIAGLYANLSSRYLGHNFTNLSDGMHTIRAYAQDTTGDINKTLERNFAVEYLTTNLTICRDLWQPGEIYVMQNDLSSSGTCLSINAGNVTLDMNGYNITGSSSGSGVLVNGYDGNTIRNGKILDFEYGTRIAGSSDDNIIIDVNISGSLTSDVDLSAGARNNTFLNASYSISQESLGEDAVLIRQWHYRANVTYPSGGHHVANATVVAYNNSGDVVRNLTTNGTGWTAGSSLIEYVNIGGARSYYPNYTINFSHPDFMPSTKSYNLTVELNNLYDLVVAGNLFILSESTAETDNTYRVAIADLDDDGDQDYIAGNFPQANRIYINNGTGGFTMSESSPEGDSTITLAIADLDNDGDKDYIAGNYQQPNRIYINNGTGHFTLSENNSETGNEESQFIAIADIDNDGDPDYVVANTNAPLQVYKNNGSANFTNFQNISGQYYAAALGDINGDGFTDMVIGGLTTYVTRTYFNNGSGYFVLNDSLPDNTLFTYDVSLADVDNDGHLDIIEANGNTPANQENRVFLNDGDGTFTLYQSIGDRDTQSIAIADLNNDGFLDFVAANYQQPNEIFINNGTGGFDLYESSQAEATLSVAAADLNNDGDIDYNSGNSNSQANSVHENQKDDSRYVLVHVKGASSSVNWDGIGTKVSAYFNNDLRGYREVTASDPTQDGTSQLHFGLSTANTYALNITYIGGRVISCQVQPPLNFTVWDNGTATNGVSCYVVDFPPQIVLMTPADGNITTAIDVDFMCQASDDNQLSSVTITVWNATNDVYYSNTSSLSGTMDQGNWQIQSMTPDIYMWNCRVLDNASKSFQQPLNYSLRVVIRNNLYIRLVMNNTNNYVYIPGVGEQNSSTLVDQIYGDPPNYYVASYLGNVLTGLVFSMRIPRAIGAGANTTTNTHYMAVEQNIDRSRVFLVFTLGDYKVIENRIRMIETGRFLVNILPSFSYGLGSKHSLGLALDYADIDLRGRLGLLRGSHDVVLENNGTSGGKPVILISRG